jgi:hypothetical protein
MLVWLAAQKDAAAALADYAQAVAVLAGVLGLIRYFYEKKLQRQAAARSLYTAFMNASVAHPELYGGAWTDGSLGTPSERQKYIYYLGAFLWAAEEILREFPKSLIWNETILVTVKEHKDYFSSDQFMTEIKGYPTELIDLIRRGVAHA